MPAGPWAPGTPWMIVVAGGADGFTPCCCNWARVVSNADASFVIAVESADCDTRSPSSVARSEIN